MKSIRKIFENNLELLENESVQELIEYCQELEGEVMDNKIIKHYDKEELMLDIIKEIYRSCVTIKKNNEEAKRFGFDEIDWKEAINNLEEYILKRCDDEKINLD